MISGFRSEVDENCALQLYYAASGGNFLPTFRDNLSVPSSGVKNLLVLSRFAYVPLLASLLGVRSGMRFWPVLSFNFIFCDACA